MREFADRYGRWITVSPEDIDHATDWFNRHGRSAVLIGRLVPGVRTLISVPAGISGMGLFPFLLYSTIGTVAWTSLLAICGYILRDQWSAVESYISPISTVLIVVLVLWFASPLRAPMAGPASAKAGNVTASRRIGRHPPETLKPPPCSSTTTRTLIY